MLITPHALFGASMTKKTNSFLCGTTLALASHFLLDAIPNWDVGGDSATEIVIISIDAVSACFLIAMLSTHENHRGRILLVVGAVCGLLPDILSQGSIFLGIQEWNPFETFHQSIQKSAPLSWSLPAQALLSVLLVAGMVYRSKQCLGKEKAI